MFSEISYFTIHTEIWKRDLQNLLKDPKDQWEKSILRIDKYSKLNVLDYKYTGLTNTVFCTKKGHISEIDSSNSPSIKVRSLGIAIKRNILLG